MHQSTYLINERPYSLYEPIQETLHFLDKRTYLFDLDYLCVLSLTGENSRDFLQGQLSCNLLEVDKQHYRQGAQCNLKGRVLALMDVIDWQGLHLILPTDLLTKTQSTLEKSAIFSKVTLHSNSSWRILGLYQPKISQAIKDWPIHLPLPSQTAYNDHVFSYALGDGFYILLCSQERATSMIETYKTTHQWRGSLAWHGLQLQRPRIEIYPSTRGLFLPHRLNLHLDGYISFDKGCYKGQEIIARTHYLAKHKYHFKTFYIKTDEPLQAGLKLYNEAEIEQGELIDFCPLAEDNFLISCSIQLLHEKQVFIEKHNKPVVLCPLDIGVGGN